ncbi:MAG TPA: phosphoglycerate kinase [bacterium]|nr:phosphoglycerate kinase [bacterium]
MKLKQLSDSTQSIEQKIFLRLDLNVPMKDGKITEDYKIKAALKTIKKLASRVEKIIAKKIIIASHLGEPLADGCLVDKALEKYSLKPVAEHLAKLLGEKIKFLPGQDLAKIKNEIDNAKEKIIVLDNLRFWPGELTDDVDFAKQLASLADCYINDAFAVSHRKQASVSAIKKFLPSFAGPLLIDEITNLSKALQPEQPMVIVLGGAKVSTKVDLIKNLGQHSNKILIGGGLANNFLAAQGYNIGQSLIDEESIDLAKKLIKKFAGKIVIPVDVVVADSTGLPVWRLVSDVKDGETILDIGPSTIQEFSRQIKQAKTIVWNGPVGKFEEEHYRIGTLFVAREIAWRSRGVAFGLVGGGETVAALEMTGMTGFVDWVSTAGGAMLAFLGGEAMPGLDGLEK